MRRLLSAVVPPLALAAALAWFMPAAALAGGVVGDGTLGSCTEAALDTALIGGGVVTFNCGGPRTISIAHTKHITLDTTISGSGVITLDGASNVLLLDVHPGASLALNGVNLSNGSGGYGGAVMNEMTATVSLSNLYCTNNRAFAGGCLYNAGRATVSNAHLTGNQTFGVFSAGGAIYNLTSAPLTVTASVLSGNYSDYAGGGIFNFGRANISATSFSNNVVSDTSGYGGGAISNDATGLLNVSGSSFTNNHARVGGAVQNTFGDLTVAASAFSGNVAGNMGGAIQNSLGVITVSGNSLLTFNNAITIAGGIWNGNGGRATVLNSTLSSNNQAAIYSDGVLVIRNSLLASNTHYGNFGGGIQNARTLTLTGSTLDGNVAYYGGGLSNAGSAFVDDNLFIRNNGTNSGGGIANSSALTVTNSRFVENIRSGIRQADGALLVATSAFTNNSAVQYGGALSIYTGSITVNASRFVSNSVNTSGFGGALDLFFGDLSITASTFISNVSDNKGGAIRNHLGWLTIAGSTFQANSAPDGGAIYNQNSLDVQAGTFVGNHATVTYGGGIWNDAGGAATLTASRFIANTAAQNGGGINNSDRLDVDSSTFVANTAGVLGGGIANGTTLRVTASTLLSNTAQFGGGILNFNVAIISNTTLSANHAITNGGAIYSAVTTYLENVTAISNSATYGGNVYVHFPGGTDLRNTIVAGGLPNDCDSDNSSVTSLGHNIDTDNTCGLNYTGDQPAVNPRLGPVRDNGGPGWTAALLPGSPAIDKGEDATCAARDERGVPRYDGDRDGIIHCDVGAFEAGPMLFLPLIRK